jgi:DNA-3-methyladenine glycosylase II
VAVEPIDIEHFLSQADPALGRLIAAMVPLVGRLRIPASQLSPFEALIRAIVYQQLATKAAEAIHKRLKQAVKGRLTPTKLRALTPEQLRAVGLSKQKAQYVHNVAEWFAANRKLAKQLPDLPDDAVIAALTDISGIGIWTANVFLMFTLGRLDVAPATDLGIQNGVRLIHRLKSKPSPAVVEKKSRQWQPYRSIACLYLWQAVTRKITAADLT